MEQKLDARFSEYYALDDRAISLVFFEGQVPAWKLRNDRRWKSFVMINRFFSSTTAKKRGRLVLKLSVVGGLLVTG